MNLYAVFADYRKNNEHRYPYYVRANSIREARTKISRQNILAYDIKDRACNG